MFLHHYFVCGIIFIESYLNCSYYFLSLSFFLLNCNRCILENSVLEAQSKTLAENCTKLETEKLALEKRDGDYWNDHTIINKLQLEEKERKVRNCILLSSCKSHAFVV